MTHRLMEIQPKVVVALEGGYNLDSIRKSSEAVIRTLMGHPEQALDYHSGGSSSSHGNPLDLDAFETTHTASIADMNKDSEKGDALGIMALHMTLKLAVKLKDKWKSAKSLVAKYADVVDSIKPEEYNCPEKSQCIIIYFNLLKK